MLLSGLMLGKIPVPVLLGPPPVSNEASPYVVQLSIFVDTPKGVWASGDSNEKFGTVMLAAGAVDASAPKLRNSAAHVRYAILPSICFSCGQNSSALDARSIRSDPDVAVYRNPVPN